MQTMPLRQRPMLARRDARTAAKTTAALHPAEAVHVVVTVVAVPVVVDVTTAVEERAAAAVTTVAVTATATAAVTTVAATVVGTVVTTAAVAKTVAPRGEARTGGVRIAETRAALVAVVAVVAVVMAVAVEAPVGVTVAAMETTVAAMEATVAAMEAPVGVAMIATEIAGPNEEAEATLLHADATTVVPVAEAVAVVERAPRCGVRGRGRTTAPATTAEGHQHATPIGERQLLAAAIAPIPAVRRRLAQPANPLERSALALALPFQVCLRKATPQQRPTRP